MEEEIRVIFKEFQENTASTFGDFTRYFDYDITDPEKLEKAPFYISDIFSLFAGQGVTVEQRDTVMRVFEYQENRKRLEEVWINALLYGLAGKRYTPRKRGIRENFISNAY